MCEECDVFPGSVFLGLHPENIGRDDVEVSSIELDLCLEVLDAEAEVT